MCVLPEELNRSRLTHQQAQDLVGEAVDLCYRRREWRIPRRDENQLVHEVGKISGVMLSSHFLTDTFKIVDHLQAQVGDKLQFFGAITLNMGFDKAVIRQAIQDSRGQPFMIIAPTFASAERLRKLAGPNAVDNVYIGGPKFRPILKKEIKAVKCLDKQGELRSEVVEAITALVGSLGILNSGLFGKKQTLALGLMARRLGIPFIASHSIRGKNSILSEKQMQKLVAAGAFLEFSFAFLLDEDFQDKYDRRSIVEQIEQFADHVIVDSDVGQVHNPSPSQALTSCAHLLSGYGLSRATLFKVMVENPQKLKRDGLLN